jgi:hypothetical protein
MHTLCNGRFWHRTCLGVAPMLNGPFIGGGHGVWRPILVCLSPHRVHSCRARPCRMNRPNLTKTKVHKNKTSSAVVMPATRITPTPTIAVLLPQHPMHLALHFPALSSYLHRCDVTNVAGFMISCAQMSCTAFPCPPIVSPV